MSVIEVEERYLRAVAQIFDLGTRLTKLEAENKVLRDERDAAVQALKRMEELVVNQQLTTEPVAWMDREGDLYKEMPATNWCPPHTPLYAAPPQRKPTRRVTYVCPVCAASLERQE